MENKLITIALRDSIDRLGVPEGWYACRLSEHPVEHWTRLEIMLNQPIPVVEPETEEQPDA